MQLPFKYCVGTAEFICADCEPTLFTKTGKTGKAGQEIDHQNIV